MRDRRYEEFKLDKEVFIREPEGLWENLTFAFGRKLEAFLEIPNLCYDHLYRLGGHLRHRRIASRFYQVWSGDYDKRDYHRSVSEWYKSHATAKLSKKPMEGTELKQLPLLENSEDQEATFNDQLLDYPAKIKTLKDSKGDYVSALKKYVNLLEISNI